MKKSIFDITGKAVEVTDLDAAIKQCRACLGSPFKMESGHTIGENHAFMLEQLNKLLQQRRREEWLPSTRERYESGKRFSKHEMGYEIGRQQPYHPAALYWDTLKCDEIVAFFNGIFGTEIQ